MKLKKIAAYILAGMLTTSVLFTGCGGSKIDPNAVGAIINGKEISLGLMNFMARYQQASTDISYAMYFGDQMSEMWSTEISQGTTMEDSTKSSIVESIKLGYALEAHMADYGVEITEEEMAAIEAAASQFMKDNGKDALNQMGATEEYIKEMLRLYTIQQKMNEAVYAASEATVTDEEAAQRTFSYVKASTAAVTDEEGNTVELTEDELTALEEEMEHFSQDVGENFGVAAEGHGYEVLTHSYGAGSSTMDEAVIAEADKLKEGEVSGVITGADGYYVIHLDSEFDEEATATAKETMLEEKKSQEFQKLCEKYVTESEFELKEDVWATVKFDKLFKAPAAASTAN